MPSPPRVFSSHSDSGVCNTTSLAALTPKPSGEGAMHAAVGNIAKELPSPTFASCFQGDKSGFDSLVSEYLNYMIPNREASNEFLKKHPELFQSQAVCKHWVELNSFRMPLDNKNPRIVLDNFNKLDDNAKTEQLYIELVSQFSGFLKHVPKNSQTYTIALKALIEDSSQINHLDQSLVSERLILDVFRESGEILDYLPNEFKNESFYLKLIEIDPCSVLSFIPDKNKTPKLCMAAVRIDGLALRFVPDDLRSQEINDAAVQQNEKARIYLPRTQWDKKEWRRAVEVNPGLIYEVPENILDVDLVLVAARPNKYFFRGYDTKKLPKTIIANAVYAAVQKNGKLIALIPDEMRTLEVYVAALDQVIGINDENSALEFFHQLALLNMTKSPKDQKDQIYHALYECMLNKYPHIENE